MTLPLLTTRGATIASTPALVVMVVGSATVPLTSMRVVLRALPRNCTVLAVVNALSLTRSSVLITSAPVLRAAPGPTMIPAVLMTQTARLRGPFIAPAMLEMLPFVTRFNTAEVAPVVVEKLTVLPAAMSNFCQLMIALVVTRLTFSVETLPSTSDARTGINGVAPSANVTVPDCTLGRDGVFCAVAGVAQPPMLAPSAVESASERRSVAAAERVMAADPR